MFMKRSGSYSQVIILIFLINNCRAQEVMLLKTQHLPHYPSASAIEFHKNKLYVIGDDATYILVLDKDYTPVDSLGIFKSSEKRISKDKKPDIEAAAIFNQKNKHRLVAISSLSTPGRVTSFVFKLPLKRKINAINFGTLRSKLLEQQIPEVNIEGATFIKQQLILSNRANQTHQKITS